MDDTIETTQAVIDQTQIVKRGLMQELFTPGSPTVTGPSEWSEEHLVSLFTLQLGKMLNKKARTTLPRFPYLANKDVQWGKLDLSNLRKMYFNDKDREKYRLLPDDLLVCEGGEVGRTAIWTGKSDCYFQNAVHRLRVRDSARVEPHFILHFMRFAAASGMFTHLTGQSTIAHLTKEKLSLLKVNLPTLPEQRKIAAILSSVDNAIEKTQAVIDQARIVKRGLLQVLLEGERDTWRASTLGSLAQVNPEQLGSRTDPDYLLEYLDISAIEQPGVIGDTRTLRFEDAPSRARRVVREGDILVSTVRPYLRNFARVRQASDNLVVSTGYAVVRPSDRVDGRFLYQHILSSGFVEYLKPRMSGSNYPAVTAHDVKAYPLFLPPLPEQRKIAAILSSVDDAIEEDRAFIDQAQIVKRGLMSVLLTGELRVTPCYSIADELAMGQAARSSR